MSKPRKFSVGDTVNNLKIRTISIENKKHRNIRYECECLECGGIFKILGTSNLKVKKDCGCCNPNRLQRAKFDKVGNRYGKLLVLKYLKTQENRNIFLCKCDCGNYSEVCSSNLRGKITNSCGRCKGMFNSKFKLHNEIPIFLIRSTIRGAKVRNLEYSITQEDMWNLFLKQNRKCALSGRTLIFGNNYKKTSASLDRIDSRRGYVLDNIQWIHKDINRMKNAYDNDYFINICEDIYHKNKDYIKPVQTPSDLDYFMGLAVMVSTKSKDSQTKVGSVLVNQNKHIISTGYNSFPKGLPDSILANERPLKYDLMIHSELNMMLNSPRSKQPNEKLTVYTTMRPCFRCLGHMINFGISEIFAIDVDISSKTQEQEDYFQLMLSSNSIELFMVRPDFSYIKNYFDPYIGAFEGSKLTKILPELTSLRS